MDAETTDSWMAQDLKLPWSWCLVALLPVVIFFAASVARAKHGPTFPRSEASASAVVGSSSAVPVPFATDVP